MPTNDKRLVVDLLAKFADDVGKLPELDQFFMLRLERALASVLEGRVRQIL